MDIIDVLFARALSGGGGGTPTLIEKTITENGTYNAADDNADGYSKVVVDVAGKPALVPWSTGTDDEIVAMVNGYYDGKLTIDEIKSVWSFGDCRSVNLSAMEAVYVGESHRAQTVELQILDFEHDTLTTAIGERTKALITVDLKDCLRDASVSDTDGSSNTENGYMNSTDTNVGGWTSCARRLWCNEVFYNSLPNYIKNNIKAVNKLTSAGNQSHTVETDSDYCFLPSQYEVFGNENPSIGVEGSRYALFTNDEKRNKLPKWNASSVSDNWWERSPHGATRTGFCRVGNIGDKLYFNSSYPFGIAPAFCI